MKARLFPLLVVAAAVSVLHATDPENSILQNGDFESGALGESNGWVAHKGASIEVEDGNHFLRLQSTDPSTQVQSYRRIQVPSGIQKLKLKFRVRYESIVPGVENWHKGSLVLHFRDANGAVVQPDPRSFTFQDTSEGWEEKEAEIIVPDGAVVLELLPALFRVQEGVLDFDDIVLIPE